MKISTLKKSKDKQVFLVEGTTSAYINSLRRLLMAEVPTMAIEDVEFRQNDSVLYDEMLALRLGLIPLKTDLKSYETPEECTCKGTGCAKCQLKFTLTVKGPKMVYAKDLNSADPKVVPVYPETPIVNLLDNQKIELEAIAILGRGKVHSKWSPGLTFFTGIPIITATKDADKSIIKNNSKILSISGNKVKVSDYLKYNPALEQDLEEAGFEIEHSETEFILTFESWGQLKVEDAINRAIEEYNNLLSSSKNLFKEVTK